MCILLECTPIYRYEVLQLPCCNSIIKSADIFTNITSMSSKPIFTHVILTAPSHNIAEVYRIQLNSLKQSVPFLAHSSVLCVPDPEHSRVGSGGGTLNALQYLKKVCKVESFHDCRLLVIHSGGESRRAPLNSLCGKAWTSINAIVEGGAIASPLLLLIKEISLFCENLPVGSLVVASSDVTLDIANKHCSGLKFDEHAVFAVAVPVDPSIAKNHGVLVPAMLRAPCQQEAATGGYVVDHAVHYFQKPTIDAMQSNGALFGLSELTNSTTENTHDSDNVYALVDSGVVIFTGDALNKLASLLDDPVVITCVDSNGDVTGPLCAPPAGTVPLRLELYTDIMLALALQGQSDFAIAEYHRRLGVKSTDSPTQTLYEQALPVVWEALKRVPLKVIIVPEGKFEHLGTTAEVLQLLTLPAPSSTQDSLEQQSHQLIKLRAFAHKYGLQKRIKSTVTEHLLHSTGVFINSILTESNEDNSTKKENIVYDDMHVLVEHSVPSGTIDFPSTAIVSHICPAMGRDLDLRDGVMMQQVQLKCANFDQTPKPSCAMIVLGIADDVKLPFVHPQAKMCGASWNKLFQISSTSPDELWEPSVVDADRTLWSAQLFPEFFLDYDGNCTVRSRAGAILPASRLTLTWLQDLPYLDAHNVAAECTAAVQTWRAARRVSLADILSKGDATRMLYWRAWLEAAHDTDYQGSSRVRRSLGIDKLNSDLYKAYCGVMEFFQHCKSASGLVTSSAAVLLSLWLSQLCVSHADTAAQEACHVMVLQMLQVPSTSNIDTVRGAFNTLWCDVMALGNPSVPHVVASFLKGLVNEEADAKAVISCLLAGVKFYSINMHTRSVFLVAWVLKGRTLYVDRAADEYTAAMVLSSGDGPPTSLRERGEAVCTAALRLVLSAFTASDASDVAVARDKNGMELMESIAQSLVGAHIRYSLDCYRTASSPLGNGVENTTAPSRTSVFVLLRDCVVLSKAPVRIDLAGGWSDTPPICYEMSGAVLNVAVLVDGKHPVRCASGALTEPIIHLHCKMLTAPGTFTTETFIATKWGDFEALSHSSGSDQCCVLLRAVCVALRLIDFTQKRPGESSLAAYLQSACGGGVAIMCVSELPPGSGMGGSSVLAAAAVQSLAGLLGVTVSPQDLIYLASQVEQILTTGGGWQDQVGAIYGGFKLGTNKAELPLSVTVQCVVPSEAFSAAFHRRVFLIYTGQQRLAKNTLINALRRSALSPAPAFSVAHSDATSDSNCHECVSTVRALVNNAQDGWDLLNSCVDDSSTEGSANHQLDQLAEVLNRYWELKKEMAAGSEPPNIRSVLDQLCPLCSGLSLCGAGAGGFAAVFLKREFRLTDLQHVVQDINTCLQSGGAGVDDFLSVHTADIDWQGMQCVVHSIGSAPCSDREVVLHLENIFMQQ